MGCGFPSYLEVAITRTLHVQCNSTSVSRRMAAACMRHASEMKLGPVAALRDQFSKGYDYSKQTLFRCHAVMYTYVGPSAELLARRTKEQKEQRGTMMF